MEALSLARLGACMERGGTIVPETFLRLVGLAGCLRSQQRESESLSWLCHLSVWIEALLVTMRFLRAQIGNCKMWSYWKWYGLLLVVLALRGPEEALWWLLTQLLRYSFLWNLWKWTGRIGPSSLRTKITFSSLGPSTTSFAITYTGVVTLSGDVLVVVHPFMTHHSYRGQDCTQERARSHVRDASPIVLAWETFQKATLLHPG